MVRKLYLVGMIFDVCLELPVVGGVECAGVTGVDRLDPVLRLLVLL